MTLPEFFGCAFLAFGPPLALFTMTIAQDPIRIIILVAAAFLWLCSLLLSSLVWFIFVPLRDVTIFGMVISIIIQEAFRYGIYRVLRETENGLQLVSDNSRIVENKHILAYVSGLGFGIMSGAFALVNILADSVGPATVGLLEGHQYFLLTSSAQALCMILLHTFWSVIFFNAVDTQSRLHIGYVIVSHLIVSCITLLNSYQMYTLTLTTSYFITVATAVIAFRVVGGTKDSFTRFITCK
ncbi:gamma-secretase subunit Aph-1 [Contarinia nasturtii]|uniref:gamma-secretase subunit Aph-1 n=1 Tax=Contarinia nasturtii TaxID=265458 RepID=UPI0012D47F38|nr:gamma-secretase subunit Aph-1 [Contarinia nasturtii]